MRDYTGTALLMAITVLVGIGCYGATTHGVAQRDAIQKMHRQLVADARAIRDLEAELRTRARLPQLERWNDEVLKMSAPAASQFMRSPVHLASLVSPPAPEAAPETAPSLRYAIAPATPAAPAAAGPTLVQARPQAPDREPARLRLAGFTQAPPPLASIESPYIPAPSAEAP
jgi:hypothetical protein